MSDGAAEDDRPTVGAVLASLTRALAPATATPRLDAEVLMAHVRGVDRTRLIIDRDEPLDGGTHEQVDRLARRRLIGEPVAYLTGSRGFRSIELAVDRRVLIPRPETEGLVEAAVAELPSGASVLDVGTGSGAIALALLTERPDLRVTAVDVSPDAAQVARANATALGLSLEVTVTDLLDGVAPVDAVVANLPYVERDAVLPVDVASFEPGTALFGGADGLELLRRLAAQMAAHPWPVWTALEIGETQGEAVSGLLRAAGFDAVEVRADLSGCDRIVIGRRPPAREWAAS